MTPLRRPTVYLETSTISYLTARPTEEPLRKAKQILTRMWWEKREKYDLFVSETVMEEISKGDKDAAERRMKAVYSIPILQRNADIDRLAIALMETDVIPVSAKPDAFHIAFAVIYELDILLTWNQKHIATNPNRREIENVIVATSRSFPRLLTPEQHLLTMENDDVY